MDVCLFLQYSAEDCSLIPDTRDALTTLLPQLAGLRRALLHFPADAHDPYLRENDAPPALCAQLYFGTMDDLENALAVDGALAHAHAGAMPTQQAMAVRRYAIDNGHAPAVADGTTRVESATYLVAYEGRPQHYDRWLGHYLDHHVPLMRQFPGIREVEIYTRVDWRSDLSWPRANAMQRNKVVFDDIDALNAALSSPVRDAMRADFMRFPPFEGQSPHYPVHSHEVPLRAGR